MGIPTSARYTGEAVKMVSTYDKISIVLAAMLITTVVLLVIYVVPPTVEWQAAKNECENKAHELGFRHLDYVHEFNECWAERPDGSIVDLFKEET